MSELDLVYTGSIEDTRKMLHRVLGEAVADEQDAELGISGAGSRVGRAYLICDVLEVRLYAASDDSEIFLLLCLCI